MKLLTIKDAILFFKKHGLNLTYRGVHYYVQNGYLIPDGKIGRSYYFFPETLKEALKHPKIGSRS